MWNERDDSRSLSFVHSLSKFIYYSFNHFLSKWRDGLTRRPCAVYRAGARDCVIALVAASPSPFVRLSKKNLKLGQETSAKAMWTTSKKILLQWFPKEILSKFRKLTDDSAKLRK